MGAGAIGFGVDVGHGQRGLRGVGAYWFFGEIARSLTGRGSELGGSLAVARGWFSRGGDAVTIGGVMDATGSRMMGLAAGAAGGAPAVPTGGGLSYKGRRWVLPDPGALPESRCIAELATGLRLPPLVATLLATRGLVDCDSARAFLDPQFRTIHEPGLLPNMGAAVERIVRAVKGGEKIVLFGDYDVDGITGTAMLWHTLRAAGVRKEHLRVYIPHRVDEGYGLNAGAIEGLVNDGTRLIVSIDCGVSALGPIALAAGRGVDVIVTDHHEFGATLPEAVAIVHPRLEGSGYPNADLCGAGVAYKLCWALATALSGSQRVTETYRNLLIDFVALVALATIADVVPLRGENRTLVKYGLQQLPRSRFTGIQALIEAAGYGEKKVDCTAVGFSLAPRLNAAGRMDHADLAVELLTTAGPERAKEIAEYLEGQNKQRQATERKMVEAAKKQIEGWGSLPRVIVVHSEAHHAGVVGIVASRLVEAYGRPTFVLACNETECHGSARSIAGFELHHAIEHCRPLLTGGGGHAMAGGVKLLRENLGAFTEALNAYAAGVLRDEDFVPRLAVDGILSLSDATPPLVGCLGQFEPFGRGNPHPRFLVERAVVNAPPRPVGATGAHVQLQLAQGRTVARAIAFKMGDLAARLHVGQAIDLVVEPRLDYWNGSARVDLVVVDVMLGE